MKKSDIAILLDQAIAKKKDFIHHCYGKDNPQIVEMRLRSEGELAAFEDVRLALEGDLVNLRISAKGTI